MTARQSGQDGQGVVGKRESGMASPGSQEAESNDGETAPPRWGRSRMNFLLSALGRTGPWVDKAGQERGCQAKVLQLLGGEGRAAFGVQWWVPGTARGSCWRPWLGCRT